MENVLVHQHPAFFFVQNAFTIQVKQILFLTRCRQGMFYSIAVPNNKVRFDTKYSTRVDSILQRRVDSTNILFFFLI